MLLRFLGVHSRRVLRLGVVAAVATGAAGCSSDLTRLSENSPNAVSDSGSVALAQAPPAAATDEVTGAIGATETSSGSGKRGDVVIVLKAGDTIDTVARKYGVSVHAITKANAMTDLTKVVPGQHLVIPRHIGHGPRAKHAHGAVPSDTTAAPHAATPKENKSTNLGQTP
jgi:LysM repeat protein